MALENELQEMEQKEMGGIKQTGGRTSVCVPLFLLNNRFSGYALQGLHTSRVSRQKHLCYFLTEPILLDWEWQLTKVCVCEVGVEGACCRFSWVLLSKNTLPMLDPYNMM